MTRTRRRSSAAVAVVAIFVLGGCAVSEPAAVKREAETPVDTAPTASEPTEVETSLPPTAEPTEAETSLPATPEPTEAETTAPPAPGAPQLGDVVTVGDWDVKVTDMNLDATSEMNAANMFNDRARRQYVLITYEATYTGRERTADAWMDLTWSFTTSDAQIHDTASGVTPADNQSWPTEARTGGTVRGQEVFDLSNKLIEGGILTVESYDNDFDTVYADFTV
jgi:hypothetical protein